MKVVRLVVATIVCCCLILPQIVVARSARSPANVMCEVLDGETRSLNTVILSRESTKSKFFLFICKNKRSFNVLKKKKSLFQSVSLHKKESFFLLI